MSDLDYKALVAEARARADAATKGPWFLDRPPDDAEGWATSSIVAATYRGQNVYCLLGGVAPEANRRFIAHARAAVPALCDVVEALLAEREAKREKLRRIEAEARWLRDLANEGHKYGTLPGSITLADARQEAAEMIERALQGEPAPVTIVEGER